MRVSFLGVVFLTLLTQCVHVLSQTSPDEVTSLPGIGVPATRTLSGFLLANATYGAHLYYLFMESQSDPQNDPVVLWLQGGPGATSMFGAFCEFGPYIIAGNGTFSNNPYSWNAKANILWIDQPVGTGYSYTENPDGYVKDELSLSRDLYTALLAFMALHPEYNSQRFYAFGESYAGKYIPWLAYTILTDMPRQINMFGSGIGDGWVDPRSQAGSYGPFLFKNDRITAQQVIESNKTYTQYLKLLDQMKWKEASDMDNDRLDKISNEAIPPVKNPYDIRYTKDITDPSNDAMTAYMKRDDVKAALYMTGRNFSTQSKRAYKKLNADEEKSALFLIPSILQNSTILLYNGQYDLICNYIGTSYYSANIPNWDGQSTFNNAPNVPWMVGSQQAGYYKSGARLKQLVVFNAGHMSPFDQPQNTQAMLYRYIAGGFN